MEWNAALYDSRHEFVSRQGEPVLALLDPQPGEHILDLGCGTGDIAQRIAQAGSDVTGLDASPDMIAEAKRKYPDIRFLSGDACSIDLGERFDAVFSNAVLHWIRDHDALLERVGAHLKPGGRFVAEFGARGNVDKIIQALRTVLAAHRYAAQAATNNWYFPTPGTYAMQLEKHGFEVRLMECFDRPTVLQDAENGIVEWLEMFGREFFRGISPLERRNLLYEIQDHLYDDLYRDGQWHADYRRLRFCAIWRGQEGAPAS